MPVQSFNTAETYMNNLIHTYHQTANSKDEIIKQLAKILDNLNYFHPFREGNGRTQREVIRSLALSKGYSAQIRVEQDDDIYKRFFFMPDAIYHTVFQFKLYLFLYLFKYFSYTTLANFFLN